MSMDRERPSAEAVQWAYLLLFGRQPESKAVVDGHLKSQSLAEIRTQLLQTPQFKDFYGAALEGTVPKTAADTIAASRDAYVWSYRWFLNRNPESDQIIAQHLTNAALGTVGAMRVEFAKSAEFRNLYEKLVASAAPAAAKPAPDAAAAKAPQPIPPATKSMFSWVRR